MNFRCFQLKKIMLRVVLLLIHLSLLKVTSVPLDSLMPSLQELKGCMHHGPLGMMTGEIKNSQITASSNYPPEWDKGCSETYGRVYQPNGLGWCAKFKSSSEWLQVDLGVPAKVTGLMIQGRGDGFEWVTAYLVSFSLDAYHWQYINDQYGNQRVVEGNSDSYSVRHAYLDEAIIARYIKFHSYQWHRHPSMRVEIIGCQVCKAPIALPPYGKVTASSERSQNDSSSCQANDGYIITNKAWCAKVNNADQWMQFDVGPPTLVTGFVTKGRGDSSKKHWVTKFRVSYSNDSRTWHLYKENGQTVKDFGGNIDKNLERYHFLNTPFVARYIRFHPTTWNRHISMRAGVLGCPYIGDCHPGFMRVNDFAPCVENLAFKKESFINSRRTQYKRHIQNQWIHGHAGRAVDGQSDHTTHSCAILDNFYVEKPVWMVDLGQKTDISGIVVVTWMAKKQDLRSSHQDYMHNLDKLTIYVNNRGGKEEIDQPENTCGFLTRSNDALFKPKLHIVCARPLNGRFVYIEASGVANRYSRLFGAILCEVMVYE